jgi:exodeoxyribonuclease III
MKLLSWNVNGLRSVTKRGFRAWLEQTDAEIVALQETRAGLHQLPSEVREIPGWHFNLVAAQRPGYSGVALYSRRAPDELRTTLGNEEFDVEGRLLFARFGSLLVVNGYFPNGSGKARDNGRVPFKLRFYRALYAALEQERAAGSAVLVVGDFNTAHREIDLARPGPNAKTSGFLPEERA